MDLTIILALISTVSGLILLLGLAAKNDNLQVLALAGVFCSVFALFLTLH